MHRLWENEDENSDIDFTRRRFLVSLMEDMTLSSPWRFGEEFSGDEAESERIQRLARSRNTAQKVVLRAKVVLKKMEGLKQEAIAEQLGTSRVTVSLWIGRYQKGGVGALLKDAPRSGEDTEAFGRQGKGHCGSDAA